MAPCAPPPRHRQCHICTCSRCTPYGHSSQCCAHAAFLIRQHGAVLVLVLAVVGSLRRDLLLPWFKTRDHINCSTCTLTCPPHDRKGNCNDWLACGRLIGKHPSRVNACVPALAPRGGTGASCAFLPCFPGYEDTAGNASRRTAGYAPRNNRKRHEPMVLPDCALVHHLAPVSGGPCCEEAAHSHSCWPPCLFWSEFATSPHVCESSALAARVRS